MPVTVILDSLAEGLGRDAILRSYPTLVPIHIDAAMAYAPSSLARRASCHSVRREGLTGAPDAIVLDRVRHDQESSA